MPSDIAIAVDQLVTNGLKALADYDALTQEQVDHIVKKASVAALDQHTALARLAVEETGRASSRTRRPGTCSRASTSRTAWAR
jgi:acetaldehyde dehydrogenase/alcohol dehydrogenase